MTQIDEHWLEIERERICSNTVIAISNTGFLKIANGSIVPSWLRQEVRIYGKLTRIHRLIAEHFLITVKRPDQTCIDHITHFPEDMNVNDVRNLRWCTKKENCNFEEAKENMSGENHSRWQGDLAGTSAKYNRALREYRKNPTEENLETLNEARLNRRKERILRKKKL